MGSALTASSGIRDHVSGAALTSDSRRLSVTGDCVIDEYGDSRSLSGRRLSTRGRDGSLLLEIALSSGSGVLSFFLSFFRSFFRSFSLFLSFFLSLSLSLSLSLAPLFGSVVISDAINIHITAKCVNAERGDSRPLVGISTAPPMRRRRIIRKRVNIALWNPIAFIGRIAIIGRSKSPYSWHVCRGRVQGARPFIGNYVRLKLKTSPH